MQTGISWRYKQSGKNPELRLPAASFGGQLFFFDQYQKWLTETRYFVIFDRLVSHMIRRTDEEIKKTILDLAGRDQRVRAVLLNGSRAIPGRTADPLQDFDIVFLVNQLDSFLKDHSWTIIFGQTLIAQSPDNMDLGEKPAVGLPVSFSYLMLFEDGNRIDLTLFPLDRFRQDFHNDSQTLVWLDKDNLFPDFPSPNEGDYLLEKPSEKQFLDACNEFWWVSTYVSKGLLRNEIIYAKAMLEGPVRKMFMKVIAWNIGVKNEFGVNLGKEGRFVKGHLPGNEFQALLKTYPDGNSANIWNALFAMTDIFSRYAKNIAAFLKYNYNIVEEKNTLSWLLRQYSETGQG